MTAPSFGALLRELRIRAGLSQTRLAERSGYDRSHVSRLEDGSRAPKFGTVLALAAALGLSDADTDRLLVVAHFPPASPHIQALLDAVWSGAWSDATRSLAACMDAATTGQEKGGRR